MIATTDVRPQLADEVEAHFATLKSAEEAVDALEQAGIQAANVRVGGPATTASRIMADTESDDARTARHIAIQVSVGAVLGGMLGAAVGAIAGAIVVSQSGGVTGYSDGVIVGIGALVTSIVGFVVGAFIGGESALPMGEKAEPEYEELPASLAIVHVHVADPDAELRAENILRQRHPIAMWRLAHGRQLSAA